jgi:hypothetical protein
MQNSFNQADNFNINSNSTALNEKNKSIIGKRIIKTQKTSNLQTYYNDI